MTAARTIEIGSRLGELERLTEFADGFCDSAGIAEPLRFKLHMILEELATNTILYGYKEASDGWLRLELSQSGGALQVVMEDGAREFDITMTETAPDTAATLEERNVGGLGIFLVKEMADSLRYQRSGDVNRVVLELKQ